MCTMSDFNEEYTEQEIDQLYLHLEDSDDEEDEIFDQFTALVAGGHIRGFPGYGVVEDNEGGPNQKHRSRKKERNFEITI